jgi:hypothetical protein
MFTIDLLKGTGRPLKSSPSKFALSTVPFIVPAVIILIMVVHLNYCNTVLATGRGRLEKIKTLVADYSEDIEYYKDMTGQMTSARQRLTEVSKVIDRHVQWSPYLQELVENMPDTIILKKLRLFRGSKREKMQDKENKDKVVFVECIKRTLRITVCGTSSFGSDAAAKEYLSRLQNSEAFMSEVKDLRIVTRNVAKLDGKDVPSYEIDCLFKTQE